MIHDSIPWRDELERSARNLERRTRQQRWTERTSYLVNRDIMFGCYTVRKLLESHRVSDKLAAARWTVISHRLTTSRRPDVWAQADLGDYYDLTSGTRTTLRLPHLCNQVIHSYMWTLSADELGKFDGVYIASDRQRTKCLFFVPIDTFIHLFRNVGAESIVSARVVINGDGDRVYADVVGTSSPD